MSDMQGEDRFQCLREGQKLLADKIANLAMISDDSMLMLHEVGEKQAQFVKVANDIAEMQKRLVQEMGGAAGTADSSSNESLRDSPRDSTPCPSVTPVTNHIEGVARYSSHESVGTEALNSTDVAWWSLALTRQSTAFTLRNREPMPRRGSVPPRQWVSLLAQRILSEPLFDYVVGLVILANAVCIGLELDMELRNEDPSTVESLEYIFISFYIFELSLHFIASGVSCLRNGWVFTDFLLVLLGSISLFMRQVIGSLAKSGRSNQFVTMSDQILILRMGRFARLARALRIISIFKSLWKLVLGLVHSFATMFSTLVVIVISIYMFACIGVEFITKDERFTDDADLARIVATNFSTIPCIMLTLIQFATMDDIASIYYPLILANPWLSFYFVPILLILSVAVMNLVTAIIVEDALIKTALDRESRTDAMRRDLKKMIPNIKHVFAELDTSKDGMIQIQELISNIEGMQLDLPPNLADLLTTDRLMDLFDFLDLDGSGELSEIEFVDGICHLALQTVPVETTQMLQLLRHNRREMGVVRRDLKKLRMASGTAWRCSTATRNLGAGAGFERPTPQGTTTLEIEF